MRTQKAEVLVVGAGPVGLFSALQLASQDIDVLVIDRESGPAAHSYACLLHPSTLALLDQHGLVEEALRVGQRIETLAFYDQTSRRAELNLAELPAQFPFMLTVPQSWLEAALERKLTDAGVDVWWDHRFDSSETLNDQVRAKVEQFGRTALGYVVPHWESVVQKQIAVEAPFVIAADGPDSTVRDCIDGRFEVHGKTESFLIYEFETNDRIENEARIVLGPQSVDAFWPLADNGCRWTFQTLPADDRELVDNERDSFVITDEEDDESLRKHAQQAIRVRAPWFRHEVKEVIWRAPLDFERRLVNPIGRNNCWLVGDAAHQTLPHAMQSMNAGLHEAKGLTDAIHRVLRKDGSLSLLNLYGDQTHETWVHMLDEESIKAVLQAEPWLAENAKRILPCLPGTGDELTRLAEKLHLEFTPRALAHAHH
jgi:2-polyprenyl-6-methoxyphenol hydroxylase-like FAD-dependent oxidoreductase